MTLVNLFSLWTVDPALAQQEVAKHSPSELQSLIRQAITLVTEEPELKQDIDQLIWLMAMESY